MQSSFRIEWLGRLTMKLDQNESKATKYTTVQRKMH